MASRPFCIKCGRKWNGPTTENEIGGRICPYCMEKELPGTIIIGSNAKEQWDKEV